MTSKERFSRMFQHKEADRVPIFDSPWGGTIARWGAGGHGPRHGLAGLFRHR